MKLPLNQTNTDIRELTEGFLKTSGDKLGSDEFRLNVLGTKKQIYTYQPNVRTPVGEDGQRDPNKHPYMKIELLTEFPSNIIRTADIGQTDEGVIFFKNDTQRM